MTRQVIVVPDLHGRLDLLEAAITHFPEAHFLQLGDVIDRGPHSIGAVTRLLELKAQGRATLLMGNHERMAQEGAKWYAQYTGTHDMGDYRRAMEGYQWWMRAGGDSVRQELGGLTLEKFPPVLLEYLRELRRVVYVTVDGGIHDHAPGVPSVLVSHAAPPIKHQQYPDPMSAALWLRPFEGPFPMPEGVVYSIHGHTPVRNPTRLGRHVYADLGAYQTGRLALLEIGNPLLHPKITVLCGPGQPERANKYIQFGEMIPVTPVDLAAGRPGERPYYRT